MRKLLILPLALLLANAVVAQSQDDAASGKLALGIQGGTQGLGINGAYAFTNKLGLRLSTNIAAFGYTDARSWNSKEYDLDMKSKFSNAMLQAEYRPFNTVNESRFLQKLAVTAGAAYFFKSEADATGIPAEDFKFGELTINKEDIGTIKANTKWKSLAPYAGLALREMKLKSKLFLNADLGSHYLSSPEVTLTADKQLSGNEANQPVLENNLKNYRWLPVLQLGLSYQL